MFFTYSKEEEEEEQEEQEETGRSLVK